MYGDSTFYWENGRRRIPGYSSDSSQEVRFYAHCTQTRYSSISHLHVHSTKEYSLFKPNSNYFRSWLNMLMSFVFSAKYPKGSVTMFALNVKSSGYETLTFPVSSSSQKVDIYLLAPVGVEGLISKWVYFTKCMVSCERTIVEWRSFTITCYFSGVPGLPRGERQPPMGRQPTIWPIFLENCMRMKKFWSWGGPLVPCTT